METKWYIKRPHLQEGYIKLKKIKIDGLGGLRLIFCAAV